MMLIDLLCKPMLRLPILDVQRSGWTQLTAAQNHYLNGSSPNLRLLIQYLTLNHSKRFDEI